MSIYFDHNATSPIRPEVIEAVSEAMKMVGNSTAPHSHGRAAEQIVSEAREAVALAMGVCAQDLIFTGSGTESDNTAILSAVFGGCKHLFLSVMDHPATIKKAEQLAEIMGVSVDIIPAGKSGQTDMEWLASRLENWDEAKGRPFVSMTAANSETGIIQDTQTAIDITHKAGGLILIDGVQALGKLMMAYLPDYLSVSAHKIGGPQGVGALYVSPDAPFSSYMIGGGQERRRRAGTVNVAGIAGFGAAVRAMGDMSHIKPLRDHIEAGLKSMEPDLIILGEDVQRLPNTSYFALPDQSSMTLMMALDLAGISVSRGMACSSGKAGVSQAVQAMDMGDQVPQGAIRISLGYTSRMEDAEHFLSMWAKIRQKTYTQKGAL